MKTTLSLFVITAVLWVFTQLAIMGNTSKYNTSLVYREKMNLLLGSITIIGIIELAVIILLIIWG